MHQNMHMKFSLAEVCMLPQVPATSDPASGVLVPGIPDRRMHLGAYVCMYVCMYVGSRYVCMVLSRCNNV